MIPRTSIQKYATLCAKQLHCDLRWLSITYRLCSVSIRTHLNMNNRHVPSDDHHACGNQNAWSCLMFCERMFSQELPLKGFARVSAVLISSDLYNDRQVWVINELSAVTLRGVGRFSTTSSLVRKGDSCPGNNTSE